GVSEAAIVRDPRGRCIAARLAPLAAVFGHGGLPSPARLGRGRRGVLSTGDRAVTVPSERPFPLPPEWPRAVGCAAEPPSTARPPPTTARPCGAARERGGEPARRARRHVLHGGLRGGGRADQGPDDAAAPR